MERVEIGKSPIEAVMAPIGDIVTSIDSPAQSSPSGDSRSDSELLRLLSFRLLFTLIGCEIVLALFHIVITWAPYGTYHERVYSMFHMDHEANFPTWFSSAQLLLVGLMLLLIFTLDRRRYPGSRAGFVWLVSAMGVFFLSADESAKFHEFVGTWLDEMFAHARPDTFLYLIKGFPSYYWALVYVPLAIPAGIVLAIFFWIRLAKARWMAIGGMAVFVLGAVVLDHIEGRFGTNDHQHILVTTSFWNFQFDIFLAEELMEMLGVTMALFAFTQHASDLRQKAPTPTVP